MNRLAASLLVVALGLAACACKSSQSGDAVPAPKASTYEGEGSPKIRFKDESPAASSGGGTSALAYVAAPFENIVYLPWKLIGGGVKGAADGVGAGFAKDKTGEQRVPILG